MSIRIVACALLVCALVATLAGCAGRRATSASGTLQVVVAENFWASIVQQLAGPDAVVQSIIANPSTDPHDYEPTAADVRQIASADYAVYNGIGYDAWFSKALAANPARRTVLDVGAALGRRAGDNPHQWYSPAAVMRVIDRVTADLTRIDPRDAAAFERRRSAFVSSALGPYHTLIDDIRAHFAGTPIGASESIVSPLAAALGLRMQTPRSFLDDIAEGVDPTAGDKATVDRQIAQHEIRVFVFNTQNSTPDVQRLVDAARRAHIPVTTVTETLTPAGATFQQWQVDELTRLRNALIAIGRAT